VSGGQPGAASQSVVAVIVTYRSAALTIQSLTALAASRASTGLPGRVIVVDNDSGDAASIAQAVNSAGYGGWAEVLRAPLNGGFGYGNNFGMAHALAAGAVDYFWLLNPDTVVEPGAALPLKQCLDERPQVGIVGSGFNNADGSDWPIAFRFPSAASEFEQGFGWGVVSALLRRHVVPRVMPRQLARVDWVAGASMMMRASLVQRLGGFDEGFFLYYEETDLCRRAAQLGYETWYQPESRVMHIAGCSTQLTKRNERPPRLPAYWFESRRRYFVLQHGLWGALWVDTAALLGMALGELKRMALRRASAQPPHLLRDFWRHSLVRGQGWQPMSTQPSASLSAPAS